MYRLGLQAVDFDQDVDPSNVNDNPPLCDPVSYESTIFSTRSATLPILSLSCTDADGDVLSATITNGAAVDRFQMNRLTLSSRNAFSYVPGAVYDHTMFEVTIAVSDGKYITDVVAYIYVVPWTTTVPTTTTTTTPRPPQVVTVVEEFWEPDLWFVVVMTVVGALFLLSLSLLIWWILIWTSVCVAPEQGMSENLVKNDLNNEHLNKLGNQDVAIENYQASTKPYYFSRQMKELSVDGALSQSEESVQKSLMRFDGKAADPVSGRSYLFNSNTGERRWL
ncbi:hypothetical protein JZ751_017825 [Albula glossodonta]|uniref:Cadherin domain-containing protein n=1 Tax=Albula glossodonta TaxID=121402 RepID=A0A8T2PPH8_9TELE|nr:hypothetical protein JZ751_017825 [Albula glossodonta]